MPFTKEQLKAYYEANRLKLNQQRSERRRLARLRQINHSEVETIPNLGIGLRQVETLDNINQVETLSEVETATNLNLESYNAEVYNQPKEIKLERVQLEKVVDIEAFNEEVYKRAGTSEETRFYTFLDGRKIVRTMCGCNPTKDFYDWCLDSCEYFTGWRNKRKELWIKF